MYIGQTKKANEDLWRETRQKPALVKYEENKRNWPGSHAKKYRVCPLMRYRNLCGIVTKYACDRRRDGQHFDRQDRVGIVSRLAQ